MKAKLSVGLVLFLALAVGYLAGNRLQPAQAQEAAAAKIEKVKANAVKVEEGEYKDIFYRRMKYDSNVEIRQIIDQDKKVSCYAWIEGASAPASLSCVKFGQ